MPLYMDIHDAPGVTPEAVAKAAMQVHREAHGFVADTFDDSFANKTFPP